MQNRIFSLVILGTLLSPARGADVRCIEPKGGSARCVVVAGSMLAHSTQAMGVDANGTGGTLSQQINATLANLDTALKSTDSSLAQVVKLNVYVSKDSAASEVESVLATVFSGNHKPAVSFVSGTLPWSQALVAMDAVAVSNRQGNSLATSPLSAERVGSRIGQASALLPVGPRVYVSGQAEKGDGSLASATRQTLASLGRTLEFLGLEKRHVVQVKSFLGPMSKCGEAEREIAAFFQGTQVPPCTFVEWVSSTPIEIELIASAADVPSLAQGPSVEVRTPPGMTTPAIYSRLTITRHPTTIFTSGLYPTDSGAPAETQLRSLFSNLKQTLDLSGSDWMHLVKATYYVSNEELSKWHNTVRPDYFCPRRPPAASKAAVAGTGRPGHGITMDFIVVPGE